MTRCGALALLIAGCAGAAPIAPVAWPPPPPFEVAVEAAPVRELTLPAIDEAYAEPAVTTEPTPEPMPAGGAPVRVHEHEIEGLYVLEVIVGEASFDARLPTVWVLHGRGDRARVPGGLFLALSQPVRLVVPQAPLSIGEGFSWLPYRVADGRTDELALALREAADRLARAMVILAATHPIRGRPVVTGFSQGGLLSFALAALHPELVSTALPHAGWLPPPLVPASVPAGGLPPIRSTHGRLDDRIPVEPTEASVAALRALGADVELRIFEGVGHEMTPEMDQTVRVWLETALGQVDPPAPAAARRRPRSRRARAAR